jgi:hypothetical protein
MPFALFSYSSVRLPAVVESPEWIRRPDTHLLVLIPKRVRLDVGGADDARRRDDTLGCLCFF